jgi:hypothetical protein
MAALDLAHSELLLARPVPAARAAALADHLFAAKGHLVGVRWAAALTVAANTAADAADAAAEPVDPTPPAPTIDEKGLPR